MTRAYLGHWHWNENQRAWCAPGHDALGTIDFRTIPQMSRPGGMPEGFGIFTYEDCQMDPLLLMDLGSDLDTSLPRKRFLQSLWPQSIGAATLRELLEEWLTEHGDVSGSERHRPIISSTIYLGGFSPMPILDKSWFQNRISIFQQDYRERRQCIDPIVLARVVGFEMQTLFGQMSDENAAYLIPHEFSGDRWLQPHTMLTDNFNRANSGSLGTASGGGAWAEIENNGHDIVSNAAASDNDLGSFTHDRSSRLDLDLSGADHYSQCDVTVLPQPITDNRAISAGPAVRFASAATTYYSARLTFWDAGTGASVKEVRLKKIVATVHTELGSNPDVVMSLPDTIRCEISGSSLKSYFNGGITELISDTAITGNTRAGIYGFDRDAAYQVDDWSASDIAVIGYQLGYHR